MFIANSEHVRARIKKFYRREAEIIYPPVRHEAHNMKHETKDFYLIISRLYHHKNIHIAIRAFNKLGWKLVIIGEGPERRRLENMAGPNIQFLGYQSDATCSMLYASCLAFIMPQEEDFGIAPVEAMMHGKPVLALKRGGALEYVQEGMNGLFFDDPHEAVLADGIRRIREMKFDPEIIKQSAKKFSWQKFQLSFSNIINQIAR